MKQKENNHKGQLIIALHYIMVYGKRFYTVTQNTRSSETYGKDRKLQ